MTVITKPIGRLPINKGNWDANFVNPKTGIAGYGKKFRAIRYGCELESKMENNTYDPITWDGADNFTIDTTHWLLVSGNPQNWLAGQDKPAASEQYPYNGMGRIVLKKNMVNGVNTLSQIMMSEPNIKYVIKYDYVLGEDVTVPANCVLEFDGGSITGGNIDFNNCRIIASELPVLDGITPYNLPIINVAWFGILPTNNDNSTKLNALFSSFSSNYDYTKRVIIKFNHGRYKINSTLVVPEEAGGLELWGVAKEANGKTTIYSENENIDCLLLLKNQTGLVSSIEFEGYGTTWDTDHYVKIVTGIRCKRADNYIPNETWDNDSIFNTESIIKNCLFVKLHTGIECWGRHNKIQHNDFSQFVVGVSFNCIEPYGLVQGGGPVRNNYVEDNNFHANIGDRAQREAEPRRGCIVVDNIHCDNLYISGNKNTSWTKLFYGYLINSMITNNYSCWSLTDKLIHVLEAKGAFINGNWLYYNNTYQEFSGEGLTPIERGSQQGIYFEGDCTSSQIINNVIMRYSQSGAIVFKGHTSFCLISNNYCYYSENTPSSTDDIIYAIVFDYKYNGDNVIINNISICNRGANLNLSNKFTVVKWVTLNSPEDSFINNNIALSQRNRGRSANRPTLGSGNSALNSELGFEYFDQELGIPIYWNGSKWIKSDGTDADA